VPCLQHRRLVQVAAGKGRVDRLAGLWIAAGKRPGPAPPDRSGWPGRGRDDTRAVRTPPAPGRDPLPLARPWLRIAPHRHRPRWSGAGFWPPLPGPGCSAPADASRPVVPTPAAKSRSLGTHMRGCGTQLADQSMITDIHRPRLLRGLDVPPSKVDDVARHVTLTADIRASAVPIWRDVWIDHPAVLR
jgi:hypothetical protein